MRRAYSLPLCLLALSVVAPFGCSSLDDADQTCQDFEGLGPCEPPPNGTGGTSVEPLIPDEWKCLVEETNFVPEPPPQPQPPVAYVVAILDFQFPDPTQPPQGFDIDLCLFSDASCDRPIDTAPIGPVQTPGAPPALYQIGMSYGFEGFIKVTAPSYVRQDYYFGGPMQGTRMPEAPAIVVRSDYITLVGQTALQNFYRDASIAPEPNTGIIGVTIGDCNGDRAEGVVLEQIIPEGEVQDGVGWTYRDGVVRQTDPPPPTDARAVTGYANLRKGTIEVQAKISFGDQEFTFGRRTLRVRPGQTTGGRIWPGIGMRGL